MMMTTTTITTIPIIYYHQHLVFSFFYNLILAYVQQHRHSLLSNQLQFVSTTSSNNNIDDDDDDEILYLNRDFFVLFVCKQFFSFCSSMDRNKKNFFFIYKTDGHWRNWENCEMDFFCQKCFIKNQKVKNFNNNNNSWKISWISNREYFIQQFNKTSFELCFFWSTKVCRW